MSILIIALAAFFASALTLFSGFGLGTLLMPVVAIFVPVELAIAITAIVHFANNLFKLGLLGRYAAISVLLRFGLPAIVFAVLGALLLGWLAQLPTLFSYSAFSIDMQVSPIKFVVGLLIVLIVLLELNPKFSAMQINNKYLPFGGMLSGFFGGLSGHQGAFRSMFLIKAGLSKQAFIATGVVLAVMVDLSRMLIYGWSMAARPDAIDWTLVVSACLSAFAGAYFGAKLLNKITIRTIQVLVSVLLIVVGLGLLSGLL